jgi:hypothetical protein
MPGGGKTSSTSVPLDYNVEEGKPPPPPEHSILTSEGGKPLPPQVNNLKRRVATRIEEEVEQEKRNKKRTKRQRQREKRKQGTLPSNLVTGFLWCEQVNAAGRSSSFA